MNLRKYFLMFFSFSQDAQRGKNKNKKIYYGIKQCARSKLNDDRDYGEIMVSFQ